MDARKEIERERRLANSCVVYYAQRTSDGMIKIAHTVMIGEQMRLLRKEFGEVRLLLTHGGRRAEKEGLQERFAACRVPGTAWFEPTLPLLRWICKTRQVARYRLTQMPGVLPLKELEKLVTLSGTGSELGESYYRDILARQVGGRIEVTLPFGRADVMTDTMVWEVEPVSRWRHGVAQALQYAAQVPQRGAIAIYGKDIPLAMIRGAVDAIPPPGLELWWLTGGKFVRA